MEHRRQSGEAGFIDHGEGSSGMAIGDPVTGGTDGSILFVGSGDLAQDNSNLFWDNTNNRLGIGTNSPRFALDIRANQSGIFGDLGASPGDFAIQWFIESTRNAGIARLGLFSSDGAGNGNGCAIIQSGQDGSATSSYLSFLTRPSAGIPTEAARFDKDGNMAIGTATTSGRLRVSGGYTWLQRDISGTPGAFDAQLYVESITTSQPARIQIGGFNSGIGQIECGDDGDADHGYFAIRTKTGSGTSAEWLRVTSAGVVNVAQLTASRPVFTDASKNLVSGSAGVASFGPAAVASITIVNGIVTAIS